MFERRGRKGFAEELQKSKFMFIFFCVFCETFAPSAFNAPALSRRLFTAHAEDRAACRAAKATYQARQSGLAMTSGLTTWLKG